MNKTEAPKVIKQVVDYVNKQLSVDLEHLEPDAMCAPTGSRVICNPPVMADQILSKAGAEHSDKQDHYPDGVVYWLGELNIILIYDYRVFYRWVAATYYARLAGLNSKQARKDFFGAIVDMRLPVERFIL